MIRIVFIAFFCLITGAIAAQDRLAAVSGTATDARSGKQGAFRRIARASLDVSGIDKVLVVASFDTKYSKNISSPRDGIYRLSDGNSESESMLQSLRNNGGVDKGIGTLVYIFDASSLGGRKNYLLEHSSSTRQLVLSSGTITAIGLTTSESGVEIKHDLKTNPNPVPTSGPLKSWSVVTGVSTDAIELVEQGDIYVSASVNSVSAGSGAGKWKLQYSSGDTYWHNLGDSTSRTFSSAAEYGISSLSFVAQDFLPGNWYFRLVHSQTEGTPGDLTTSSAHLVACALIYEVEEDITREFPSFSIQSSYASTTGASMTPLLSHTFEPSTETDLFLQAQYIVTADGQLDAAGYDLVINENILNGTDQFKYISSSSEAGGGGSVGLGTSLQAGSTYEVYLRHKSADGINLVTRNATLSGFQLTSVGNSLWKGGDLLLPTAWDQNENWIGEVPGPRENAIIPAGALSYPILQTHTECQDLSVRTGGSLTLESSSSLTINGISEIDGLLEVQSDGSGSGSLIVLGPSTGDITYNSHLTADRWYIVSSPITGQPIQSFLNNNEIPSNPSDLYGLTDYSEANNGWNSYFPGDKSGNFNTCEGYLMRRKTPDGSVSYTGGLVDSDLQYEIYSTVSGWNAVGNPFPSSLGVTSDAATAENFLTINLDQLDPNYSVLYLWDEQDGYTGTQNNYKVIGNAGYIDDYGYEELQMDYLQAGQGFLVKSVDGGGSLRISKAMQIHRNSTGLVKSAGFSWDGFKLVATHGERSESTIVCFDEEMSPGLDPSYDAGLLNSKPEFSVYTSLLEEDPGIGFKVQCLPHPDSTEMVIPVGVDLLSGGEIIFSTAGVYLPSFYQILIEDRLTGQLTDITSQGTSYEVVLEENAQDTGRFFLHIKNPIATAVEYKHPQDVSFYAYYLHPSIAIHGRVGKGATAYLMDMTGRYLGSYSLQKGDRHEIPASSLKSGLYLLIILDGSKRETLKILKN